MGAGDSKLNPSLFLRHSSIIVKYTPTLQPVPKENSMDDRVPYELKILSEEEH